MIVFSSSFSKWGIDPYAKHLEKWFLGDIFKNVSSIKLIFTLQI